MTHDEKRVVTWTERRDDDPLGPMDYFIIGFTILVVVLAAVGICRADSTKVVKRQICRIDTIYCDTIRAPFVIKSKPFIIKTWGDGRLDSVYTLPHDSIVWSLGPKFDERGNPNRVTLKIPGAWWYFNWSNGKRVNMRKTK